MKRSTMLLLCSLLPACQAHSGTMTVDHRYKPVYNQTCIGLVDDWQKTLVAEDGSLLYDFSDQSVYRGFATRIVFGLAEGSQCVSQKLSTPRTPIVRTLSRGGGVEVAQEAFAEVAVPNKADSSAGGEASAPRRDMLIVTLRNSSKETVTVRPTISIESQMQASDAGDRRRVRVGNSTELVCDTSFEALDRSEHGVVLRLAPVSLAPRGRQVLCFRVVRGSATAADDLWNPSRSRALSEQYWAKANLPYEAITVPDKGIQSLLDSSIRNIYQAREMKNGLPAFQVGPTVYRGLWVIDGSFLFEAMTYLGRTDEVRNGIRFMMGHQQADGSFSLLPQHVKETGIALWAVTRNAQLTGDKDWLKSVWPSVEKGFDYIRKLREQASTDATAAYAQLLPPGFCDGGLAYQPQGEYNNAYWTLIGMRSAVEAARWIGRDDEASSWQREYSSMYRSFRRLATRDMRPDSRGNIHLPIVMGPEGGVLPQKAQWAFLHAVFPGKLFSADDALVTGNLAMLKANEKEGLVLGTGWMDNGLWTYFASFYAHAWLWTGDGQKAAQVLYDFANHSSPTLVWREEQLPTGGAADSIGDMPHNWASAEFIRLVRHMLVLERGDELHLFEGMPRTWAFPGAVTRLRKVATEFGPTSLELRVSPDGSGARLKLAMQRDRLPGKIVVHLTGWSGREGHVYLSPADAADCWVEMK